MHIEGKTQRMGNAFPYNMRFEFCAKHIYIMVIMFSDTDLYIMCNLCNS